MEPLLVELAKLLASILAITLVVWLIRYMGLGGDVRIRDEAHARALAEQAMSDFEPAEIIVDKAGIGALMKDACGRHMLIRRHGTQFVGRILDGHSHSRLDQNFLTLGTGEKSFGAVTLHLGAQAQYWASGLRSISKP
jgi:hypothetical protein